MVNNTVAVDGLTIMESSLEDWNAAISANLTGAFLGMWVVVPGMREGGGGSIVNVSSLSIRTLLRAQVVRDCAPRSKLAAVEFADDYIRVNSVQPGNVPTSVRAYANQGDAMVWHKRVSMDRTGRSDEVAAAVLLLASKESSQIAGTELFVYGGLTQGELLTARRRLVADVAGTGGI